MGYEVVTKSGELYHHGIAGQKWGVQNGPPYPLKETIHDKIVKKAKTEEGKTGAEIGKTVGKIQSTVNIITTSPAAVAYVAALASVNLPAAIGFTAGYAGGLYVNSKLNTIADAWIGSKVGDYVGSKKK